MENYEMLKALYDFQAAHSKTISFDEGDYFVLYQTSAKQRNWWPVVNIKGNIGFVPSNYVQKLKVEPNFLINFLASSIESLEKCENDNINGIIKKDELLQRLLDKKYLLEQSLKEIHIDDGQPQMNISTCSVLNMTEKSLLQFTAGTVEEIKFIQESPSMRILNIQNLVSLPTAVKDSDECASNISSENNIVNYQFEEKKQIEINDTDKEKKDNTDLSESVTKNVVVSTHDVYSIIDSIRRNTNLSFDLSCEALRVVLTNLEKTFPNVLDIYLEAIAQHITKKPEAPKELLGLTHDAKRLQSIFSQLANCKNDVEQRTWMVYEDEEDISQLLKELTSILNNADENICRYKMSCDHYQSLINLVQYYQMETRWCIKKLLLEVFSAACHLDHIIVDILLTSILPLEIVEDMKTNFSDIEKFSKLLKLLTLIFSLGLAMPVNHLEQLDVQFLTFLFEIIEQNQTDTLVDNIIALILAFNLQFSEITQNIVIQALQNMNSAKIFTQKILLLLNREENPVKMLKYSSSENNAVLKMFEDLLSLPETASLFYINDNKVLIDIIVRQLCDLSVGEPMRKNYLELCRKIVRNTNYAEHTHRKQDLIKIFTRIFCEETECSARDQQLVRDIANEFPDIFKA